MPKRRRLFTPNKKIKSNIKLEKPEHGKEVNTARGRLMGALMEVLDPTEEPDSDESNDESYTKQDRRRTSSENREFLTDEEAKKCLWKSTPKQSYVLKLFDRSVDLSQFREDTPLYPVCRAWIANQPKADYTALRSSEDVDQSESEGVRVELPGASGPQVSRVPERLPAQREADKNNINLNYREAPPPSREQLLRQHLSRWAAVKQAWIDQAAKVEARYEETQQVLNKINIDCAR